MLKRFLIGCALLLIPSGAALAQICDPSVCADPCGWPANPCNEFGARATSRLTCTVTAGRRECRITGSLGCSRMFPLNHRDRQVTVRVPSGYRLRAGTERAVTTNSFNFGSTHVVAVSPSSMTCRWSCTGTALTNAAVQGYCAADADRTRRGATGRR